MLYDEQQDYEEEMGVVVFPTRQTSKLRQDASILHYQPSDAQFCDEVAMGKRIKRKEDEVEVLIVRNEVGETHEADGDEAEQVGGQRRLSEQIHILRDVSTETVDHDDTETSETDKRVSLESEAKVALEVLDNAYKLENNAGTENPETASSYSPSYSQEDDVNLVGYTIKMYGQRPKITSPKLETENESDAPSPEAGIATPNIIVYSPTPFTKPVQSESAEVVIEASPKTAEEDVDVVHARPAQVFGTPRWVSGETYPDGWSDQSRESTGGGMAAQVRQERKRLVVEKEREAQDEVGRVRVEYTAIRFLDEVPKFYVDDKEKTLIPEWQRIIMAGKIARKSANEKEAQILKDLEAWKQSTIPEWKKQLIRRSAEVAK